MNGKCIFRGKKSFASALLAAAILAAMALLFSCGGGSASSGDSYVSGDFGTGGNGTGGGDNTGNEGNEGEGNGGENGNESGDDDEQSSTIDSVSDVLKLVIGEAEYTKIAEDVSSGNLTLTAQTIKVVGDTFSGLSEYKNEEKKIDNINTNDKENISKYKDAFVAQDKGLINITTSKLNSYTIPVKFSGTFNLSEISLPTTNDGKGDFENATLTNNGEGISIDKLNTIRGTSLPTLIFNKNETNVKETDAVSGGNIYNLYKAYSDDLGKIQIKGTVSSLAAVNGKKISGSDEYTLFSDANTVKSSLDTSVKSLTIDAMVQMYKQLDIKKFVNMIISGDAKEANVDWKLTNIVFEGDMSNITNKENILAGIVYFKGKVYKTTRQDVEGMLKLDILDGMSTNTFKAFLNYNSSVLDVRGAGKNADTYTGGGILAGDSYAHAIYFSDYFSDIIGSQTKINKLCDRFSDNQLGRFIYAYLGDNKVEGQSYSDNSDRKTYGSPRTLKDFENFGNTKQFENGDTFALNNKRCFSSTAKSLG